MKTPEGSPADRHIAADTDARVAEALAEPNGSDKYQGPLVAAQEMLATANAMNHAALHILHANALNEARKILAAELRRLQGELAASKEENKVLRTRMLDEAPNKDEFDAWREWFVSVGEPIGSHTALAWDACVRYKNKQLAAANQRIAELTEEVKRREMEYLARGGIANSLQESIYQQLDKAEAENARLRTALKFYADESNWDNEVISANGEDEWKSYLNDRTLFVGDRKEKDYADGWDVAKAALATREAEGSVITLNTSPDASPETIAALNAAAELAAHNERARAASNKATYAATPDATAQKP